MGCTAVRHVMLAVVCHGRWAVIVLIHPERMSGGCQVSTHLQRRKQLAWRHQMGTKLAGQAHVHLGVLLERFWMLVPGRWAAMFQSAFMGKLVMHTTCKQRSPPDTNVCIECQSAPHPVYYDVDTLRQARGAAKHGKTQSGP